MPHSFLDERNWIQVMKIIARKDNFLSGCQFQLSELECCAANIVTSMVRLQFPGPPSRSSVDQSKYLK